jgi:hypothetical protein
VSYPVCTIFSGINYTATSSYVRNNKVKLNFSGNYTDPNPSAGPEWGGEDCDGKSIAVGTNQALINFNVRIDSVSYPTNPYLDVSGDGDTQWSFSGNFNQTNNQTSDFSSEINSYLKTCYPYVDGTCDVPLKLHSDSAGIMQIRLNATITYDSQTFDSSVYEGQNSNFWIKVNSTSDIQNVNAWLVWNNTSYSYSTKQQDGSYWTFTKSLTIPSVNADTNISFYWNFTYSNATNTYAQNFSSHNQTVYRLSITNCTSGNFTLNFTGYNEKTKALMNYNMDATLTYWPLGKPFTKNFSYSYTGNNTYYFCIYPSNAILYADADMKYWNDSFSTRYYYLQNATLTNSTSNINLYLLPTSNSTLIAINVLDEIGNPVSNVIVQALKQEIGTGIYILVAEGKSDFSGYAYPYLELHQNYKFILTQNGVVLKEYQPMQLETTSLELRISTAQIPHYFSYYDKVATSCSYNNATNVLTCVFIDTSGMTMRMNFTVLRLGQTGYLNQCSDSSTGSSGTFVCTLSSNSSYKYAMVGYYSGSATTSYTWQSGFINLVTAGVTFGVIGLIIALIIVGTLPFVGLYDMRVSIVLTAFGMIFSIVTGLIRFTSADQMAMIFSIAIVSGIVVWKVKT